MRYINWHFIYLLTYLSACKYWEVCVQAEKLIQEQLAENETATLLCYLGDVTGDPEHYRRAWEVSGQRNARSQRSLAYFYFNKAQVYSSLLIFCLTGLLSVVTAEQGHREFPFESRKIPDGPGAEQVGWYKAPKYPGIARGESHFPRSSADLYSQLTAVTSYRSVKKLSNDCNHTWSHIRHDITVLSTVWCIWKLHDMTYSLDYRGICSIQCKRVPFSVH